MKTLKLIATGIILFAASNSQAQVSVNVNIGRPAVIVDSWVPRNHVNVDFYYLPEIQTYYDVHTSHYVYLDNGNWCRTRYLPTHYRNYDLSHARRVELRGYHGSRPYTYYTNHHVKHYNKRYVAARHYYNNDRHYDKHRKYDNRRDRDDRRDYHRDHDRGHRGR